MSKKIEDIYFTNDEMREAFSGSDGLVVQSENDNYFEVVDEYETDGRLIRFHKENFEFNGSYVDGTVEALEGLEIQTCLDLLPRVIFANIKKIVIVGSQSDIEALAEKYIDVELLKNEFGLFSRLDGVIFLNLELHEQLAETKMGEFKSKSEAADYEILVRENVWLTLVYYLYRSMQMNPLLQGVIDISENAAKEFCDTLFERSAEASKMGRELDVTLDIEKINGK